MVNHTGRSWFAMMINKAVFYASEVAAILGYSTHTVYHLIHTKQLPAFRDKGCKAWRIPESAIIGYVNSRMAQQDDAK